MSPYTKVSANDAEIRQKTLPMARRLAKDLLGGSLISPALELYVQNFAILVDRTP
jgi:hypothetical protein